MSLLARLRVSDCEVVHTLLLKYEASHQRPAKIVAKLNEEINAGLADPKIKARLADLGGAVLALSPADFETTSLKRSTLLLQLSTSW